MAGLPCLIEPDLEAGSSRFFVAVSTPDAPLEPEAARRAVARLREDRTWTAWARGTIREIAGLGDRPFVPPLAGERWMAEAQAALDAGRWEFRYGDAAFAAALAGWDDDAVRADVARLLDPAKMRVLSIEPGE
jgi:hypothetical protein